jgi:FkbM family methyltransferase
MLRRAFKLVEKGLYLDIGAQDPILDSVSQSFYQLGWRGIHVEPTQSYSQALRYNRPDERVIEAVVNNSDRAIDFYEIPKTGLSTGVKEIADRHEIAGWKVNKISVPSVKLSALFDMFAEDDIHWMKIDVEGMEKDVLDSWGDHPARPWVVLIESTVPTTEEQSHAEWINLLRTRDYNEVYFDGLNRYFVSDAHAVLREAFYAPPNIFDGFLISEQHFSAQGIMHHMNEMSSDIAAALEIQKKQLSDEKSDEALQYQNQITDHLQRLTTLQLEHHDEIEHIRSKSQAEMDELRKQIALAQTDLSSVNTALAQVQQSRIDEIRTLNERHRANIEKRDDTILNFVKHARDAEASLVQKIEEIGKELALEQERHQHTSAHQSGIITQKDNDIASRTAAMAELSARLSDAEAERADERLRTTSEIAALTSKLNDASLLIAEASSSDQWGHASKLQRFLGGPQKTKLYNRLKQHILDRQLDIYMPATNSNDTVHTYGKNEMLDNNTDASGAELVRARTLSELLDHDDSIFVRCAYLTVLGRAADADGYSHYLGWLRRGAAKQSILWQLRKSAEGRAHDPLVAGLDREIKRYRYGKTPVFGGLFLWASGGERDRPMDRRLRATTNAVSRLRDEIHLGHMMLGKVFERQILVKPEPEAKELPSVSTITPVAEKTLPNKELLDESELSPQARRIFRRAVKTLQKN